MKLNSKFVALLATGITTASANAASVFSSTSDAEAIADNTTGAVGNSNILAGAYYSDGRGTVPVFAFQLPTLGAGESFATASITIEMFKQGTFTFNGDVVGIRSNAADTVLGSDWAASGTMLHDNFLTSSTADGEHTSNDFAGWLNTQNDGEFVFIKLDAEGYVGAGFNGYRVYSGNELTETKPTLNYTTVTIPEPSSTALLGLGGLALILRRRK